MTPPPPNQAWAPHPVPPPRKRTNPVVWIIVALAVLVFMGLVGAAIVMPRLSKVRMSANEMGALSTISRIHQAEAQYFSEFGKYAGSLQELGPPTAGTPGPNAADLIPAALATTGEASAYRFSLQRTAAGYEIHAEPTGFATTGTRTFFADQSMVIHQHYGAEPASSTDAAVQ
jgi:type IV pilus assembly protein PilA